MKKIRIGTVFTGIGAAEQAFKNLNIPHVIQFACDTGGILLEEIISSNKQNEYELLTKENNLEKLYNFSNEILENSKKTNFVKQTYLANYDLNEQDFHSDIRFIGSHLNKEIDILIGGSPCQSFSNAGKRLGFQDQRGVLFFEYARLLDELKPSCFIFENVEGLLFHDNGKTLRIILNTFVELGYDYHIKVLSATDFNIPQGRKRIFIVGLKNNNSDYYYHFKFPKSMKLEYTLQDLLSGNPKFKTNSLYRDEPVDETFYMSEKLIKSAKNVGYNEYNINRRIALTLLTQDRIGHFGHSTNIITENNRWRFLTTKEKTRIMGFPNDFIFPVSKTMASKQLGNSIVVSVIQNVIDSLRKINFNII